MSTDLSFSEKETNTIALLRVMATMGVLTIHLSSRVSLPGIWGQIASFGADGVKAYFLFTGYLVMHSWQSRKSTKDYWRKRLGRTLPIYYTWLVVLIIFRFDWITADPFAILRALFMLEYIAPPTVSYSYCAMDLLGVLTIFMMFYLVIPVIGKIVKSIDSAFICFWIITAISIEVPSLYAALYNGFCNSSDVLTMSTYLANSLPYFGAGILIYYGKRNQKIEKLLFYLIFIAVASCLYPFLNLGRTGWLIVLIGVLLCYPLQFCNVLNEEKKVGNKNMLKICGGGYLRNLDHLGMGVFVSQYLCFDFAQKVCSNMNWGKKSYVFLMLSLPYVAAFFLYRFVEIPGKKLIDKLMK